MNTVVVALAVVAGLGLVVVQMLHALVAVVVFARPELFQTGKRRTDAAELFRALAVSAVSTSIVWVVSVTVGGVLGWLVGP